jgi:hypothetical protein
MLKVNFSLISILPQASLWHKAPAYLNNGNVEKNTTQPDSNGGGSHDCRTCKEADSHRDGSKFVATSDDPWLQGHEQA